MQTTHANFITRAEWRWVILVSVTLLVVAFLPFMVVALLQSSDKDWVFMGALHQFRDAAAQLSRMKQGVYGDWLVHFLHTPEPHKSALIEPLYAVLGQVAGFTNISIVLLYHVVRMLSAFLMYASLYQLGANIWSKVRARRLFFVTAAIGSGLGWLVAIISGQLLTLDVTVAQAFPFFATLYNIHYALAIACIALLSAILIPILRPGYREDPSVRNGGGLLVLLVIGLAFLYPQAILPLLMAVVGCMLWGWFSRKQYYPHETKWLLWIIVPALPIGAYYALTIFSNPVVAKWLLQQSKPSLNPVYLVLGLGFPLLIGLPALWRGVRRFEADGDRLMLMWLVIALVVYYLPLTVGDAFLTGLMIPIAYFATRALEDVWLQRIARPARRWFFTLSVPVVALTPLFVLFVPIAPFVRNEPVSGGSAIEPDYVAAFDWLQNQTDFDVVVLAAPEVSAWVPMWTDALVYYGHPTETMDAERKLAMTQTWFSTTDPSICRQLRGLQASEYGTGYFINYILVGPRERTLGNATCAQEFELVATFGRVEVYYCDDACQLSAINRVSP